MMKHIFIINPMAGSGREVDTLKQKIFKLKDIDFDIYVTKGPKDATKFVKNYCAEHPEKVRFYACGGDGTIEEVATGVVQCENAELSCYPCGSGNDFVKCFGGKDAFGDLVMLTNLPAKPIDLIKVNDRYSINAVSFGFDSNVLSVMTRVKRKKIIGGRNSYTTGIVVSLLKAMRNKATVYLDGEKLPNEEFLLSTIANGQYIGGSYKCAPRSKYNDGYLEFCQVKCISRARFVKIIGTYKDGSYLMSGKNNDILNYKRVKSVRIEAKDGIELALDGEIVKSTVFDIEVVPSAIPFAAPNMK